MRCLGVTRRFHRCNRFGRPFFCVQHRFQPLAILSLGFGLSVLLLALAGLWFGAGEIVSELQPGDGESDAYSAQLQRLQEIADGLERAEAFVDSQRRLVLNAQSRIRELEEERDKLAPMVEADRRVVEAIFSLQAERRRNEAWLERLIGFSLGVVASLVASWLLVRAQKAAGEASVQTSPEEDNSIEHVVANEE